MKPPAPQNRLTTEIARLPRRHAERPEATQSNPVELHSAHGPVLVTVLFTDIVGSVALAWQLGNRKWRDLLEQHDRLIRQELEQRHGREIDTAGDGFFAVFERPGEAIDCACAIRNQLRAIGLDIRAGLHAGELEPLGSKLVGIAASLGARITNIAAAGEILASSTVKDLVDGTGIAFRDRGSHQLRGVPGRRRLFAIEPRGVRSRGVTQKTVSVGRDGWGAHGERAPDAALWASLLAATALQRRRN